MCVAKIPPQGQGSLFKEGKYQIVLIEVSVSKLVSDHIGQRVR